MVGGSNSALAFALDAFVDALDEQLAMSIANGSKTIKAIFQSVEMSVSSQSHMFDVGIECSGQESDECAHLLLALPTLRASHDITDETRVTHLLSLSLGVNVATREATAITLAAICRRVSTFSVIYSIIRGKVTSYCWCMHPHQRGQNEWRAWQPRDGRRVVRRGYYGKRSNGSWLSQGLRSLQQYCRA